LAGAIVVTVTPGTLQHRGSRVIAAFRGEAAVGENEARAGYADRGRQ